LFELIRLLLGSYLFERHYSIFTGKDNAEKELFGLISARCLFIDGVPADAKLNNTLLDVNSKKPLRILVGNNYCAFPPMCMVVMTAEQLPTFVDSNIFKKSISVIEINEKFIIEDVSAEIRKLLTSEQGVNSFLKFGLDGRRKYTDEGFIPPLDVERATDELKKQNEIIGWFINDNLVKVHPEYKIGTGYVYNQFKFWGHHKRLNPSVLKGVLSAKTFWKRMRDDFGVQMDERGINPRHMYGYASISEHNGHRLYYVYDEECAIYRANQDVLKEQNKAKQKKVEPIAESFTFSDKSKWIEMEALPSEATPEKPKEPPRKESMSEFVDRCKNEPSITLNGGISIASPIMLPCFDKDCEDCEVNNEDSVDLSHIELPDVNGSW